MKLLIICYMDKIGLHIYVEKRVNKGTLQNEFYI
jgi:hypothetical protein